MVYDGICQQPTIHCLRDQQYVLMVLHDVSRFHDVWIIDNYSIFFHAMPSSQLLQLTNSRAHLNNSIFDGAVPLNFSKWIIPYTQLVLHTYPNSGYNGTYISGI